MTTYAKRPLQSVRLAQPAQKRQSKATVPSIAPVMDGDVLIETTLSPRGAMVPAIRRKRAEQSSGSGGKSSERQAVIKSSVVAASGTCSMIASELSDHGASQSPAAASSSLPGMVNIPSSFAERVQARAKPFDGYRGQFNPAGLIGLCLMALSGLGVIWTALTLIDAWSKV